MNDADVIVTRICRYVKPIFCQDGTTEHCNIVSHDTDRDDIMTIAQKDYIY